MFDFNPTNAPLGVVLIAIAMYALLLAGLVGILYLYRLTFAPLQMPRGRRAGPIRFVLSDILVLMVVLQPSLALLMITGAEREGGCVLFLALLLSLAISAAWLNGVQTLSNAGVMTTSRRVIYLLVVGPLATIATVLMAVDLMCLAVCAVIDASLRSVSALSSTWLPMLCLTTGSAALFTVAAWLTRWVARGADQQAAPQPAADGKTPGADVAEGLARKDR